MSNQESRGYELVYIIQPDVNEDGLGALNERITQAIVAQGGEIAGTELWGKRALAYPIKKKFEGHYVLHRVNMPGSGLEEVERLLRFNEDVMRYLFIRTAN